MLKLAVFNPINYSFKKKTWVSDMASWDLGLGSQVGRIFTFSLCEEFFGGSSNLRKLKDVTSQSMYCVFHKISRQFQGKFCFGEF